MFDAGRLQANLDARRADVDASIEAYNGALLRALREVADELTGLRSIERQQVSQRDATAAANAASAGCRMPLRISGPFHCRRDSQSARVADRFNGIAGPP